MATFGDKAQQKRNTEPIARVISQWLFKAQEFLDDGDDDNFLHILYHLTKLISLHLTVIADPELDSGAACEDVIQELADLWKDEVPTLPNETLQQYKQDAPWKQLSAAFPNAGFAELDDEVARALTIE